LHFPLVVIAQKNDVFVRLTDARGQQIRGDVVLKGFENCLGATSMSSSGKSSTQLNFTMNVTGASADLKRAMTNGEFLLNGQVIVTAPNPSGGRPLTSYSIKMENIAVVSCYEAIGCNNAMNTTVMLQVTRIGWTYYNTTSTGAQVVSRKFGWDVEKNMEWTSF
jgi:type VI protein secretion system component Hcp